jgi:hypothetical protein
MILINTFFFGKSIFSKNLELTAIFLIYFYLEENMDENLNNVTESCGIAPDGVSYYDPGNDPNFVFVQDPNFEIVTLYDVEGNIANMNSWFECAHYVNGGWSSAQILNYQGDRLLFISILVAAIVTSVYYVLDLRKKYAEK